jgi:hypothetical protein
MSWARLLKWVFDIDINHCPNCGGTLKIIAAIEDPPVILRILTNLTEGSNLKLNSCRWFWDTHLIPSILETV